MSDVEEFLTHDDPDVRRQAANSVYNVVDTINAAAEIDTLEMPDEAVLERTTEQLLTLLGDENPDVREAAAMAAPTLADVAPDAFQPHTDEILAFIEREPEKRNQVQGHMVVRRLLDAHPSAVTPAMLESGSEDVRTAAAGACATLARTDPDAVVSLLPTVVERLDDPETDVVDHAMKALRQTAAARPEAVEEALETTSLPVSNDDLPDAVSELL